MSTRVVRFEHEGREWDAYVANGHVFVRGATLWHHRVFYDIQRKRITEFKFGPSLSGDARIGAAKFALAEALAEKALGILSA
jgi:hypothetical protein